MRIVIVLLSIFFLVSCRTKGQTINFENYNKRAAGAFLKNYSNHPELDKISKLHKCILNKTISLYLDDLNNWKTIVADSFFIRQYVIGDLNDNFAFIANRKRIYFIFIPEFRDRIFNKKYYSVKNEGLEDADEKIENKDSIGNYIIKLNNPFFDEFVATEINGTSSLLDQLKQVDHLLPSIFPGVLGKYVPLFVLNDSLARKRPHQYLEISKVIEPILLDESIPAPWGPNFQVYRNHIGFILLHFKESENDSKQLSVDFYFIPDNRRHRYLMDLSSGLYRDCPRE